MTCLQVNVIAYFKITIKRYKRDLLAPPPYIVTWSWVSACKDVYQQANIVGRKIVA